METNIQIKREMLNTVSQTLDTILNQYDTKHSQAEAIQSLMTVAYSEYHKKIKYPEIRFLLFDNGFCKMEVLEEKRK